VSFEQYDVSVYDGTLGQRLGCAVKNSNLRDAETGLILQPNPEDRALELCWGPQAGVKELPFRIDFTSATAQQRRRQAKSELVCKAFGGGGTRHVCDLTGGLGRDSVLLAAAGFSVVLVERNPVLYCLLHDALVRLRAVDAALGARLQLVHGDSAAIADVGDLLSRAAAATATTDGDSDGDGNPAVTAPAPWDASAVGVYLDPMYDANQVGKRSNVKKDTAMLHRLVRDPASDGADSSTTQTSNNDGLFAAATRLVGTRIVVKRPLKAPPLLGKPPNGQVVGSTHRFDVYHQARKTG
jgi:16S rRNA (guanine1516-N2)-methyltransferase